MVKTKKKAISIRLRPNTLEKVEKIAESKEATTSEVIRGILEKYINDTTLEL